MTGVGDISKRGQILEFDSSPNLNFWKKGSKCDTVKGALDSATLPTRITRDMELDVFIALICRKSLLVYEKVNWMSTRNGSFISMSYCYNSGCGAKWR